MSDYKKSLRDIASRIFVNNLKIGDKIEFIDNTPSPVLERPVRTLTIGKVYTVTAKRSGVVEVINDSCFYVFYYANRFRKVE